MHIQKQLYIIITKHENLRIFLNQKKSLLGHYLYCRENSFIFVWSICFQLTMGTNHLTFVAETEFGLRLLQYLNEWPVMVYSYGYKFTFNFDWIQNLISKNKNKNQIQTKMNITNLKITQISHLHMGGCKQSLLSAEMVLQLSGLSMEKQTLHCTGNSSHLCQVKRIHKHILGKSKSWKNNDGTNIVLYLITQQCKLIIIIQKYIYHQGKYKLV